MTDEQELKTIREAIDTLDGQIQELITRRAELAERVAHIKLAARSGGVVLPAGARGRGAAQGQGAQPRPARRRGDGAAVPRDHVGLPRPRAALNIAFLGPEGTFTQAAALKHFGHSVRTQPFGAIPDVFREVEGGTCRYGVVPVENSTEGVSATRSTCSSPRR